MIVSGHQPNYLPYLGFFDKLKRSDIFIVENDVQFEKQGFTNRNKIKTVDGVRWLTVPIEHVNGPLLISQVKIANKQVPDWAHRHWLTLKHNYCRASYWHDFSDFFEAAYQREWTFLVDLNMHLIKGVMNFFNIKTPLIFSSSLGAYGRKSELIIAQCKAIGASVQLAGNGGRDYIDCKRFDEEGIKVVFQDFQAPCYDQLHGKFVSNLSVVDYLFCVGPKTGIS
jgi:hypothetical protein